VPVTAVRATAVPTAVPVTVVRTAVPDRTVSP
jgi:hypothetical protein